MDLLSFPVRDDRFRDLVEWACDLEQGPWIAGGSVRKVWQGLPWTGGDVDFFFRDRQQFNHILSMLPALGERYKVVHDGANAITYMLTLRDGQNIKLQVIRKTWYSSQESLLAAFDFNLAQFVSDGVTILTTASAVDDIRDNVIRANPNRATPINPLRVLKYAAYGFDPDPKLLMYSAARISTDDVQNLDY